MSEHESPLGRMSRSISENKTERYTRIRPDSRFSSSHFDALNHLFHELLQFRSHIITLFERDFRANYRGTKLGAIWNIAIPLLPVSVYVLLASFRVIPSFEGIPSAVAISFNAMIWFFLAGCIQQPINVVKNRNLEAMKTALPLSISIAASFARLLFDTLTRAGLVLLVMFFFSTWPTSTAILAIVVFLCSIMMFLGLGILLAIVNIVSPDIEKVATVILQYGLFISGVIFPLSSFGSLAILETINPFAIFISAARNLVFADSLPNIAPILFASIIGIIIFIYSVRVFYIMEQRIRGVF